jgi:hypothetical protein
VFGSRVPYRTNFAVIGIARGAAAGGRTTILATPIGGWCGWLTFHNRRDLVGIDGLVLHQGIRHEIELVAILFQYPCRRRVAVIDNLTHFLIDRTGGLVGYRLRRLAGRTAQEHFFTTLVVHQRPHTRQAPFGHHVARHLCGSLDVVGGTGGDAVRAERHLFGDTTAEQAGDLADDVAAAVAVAILFGQEHGHTQGPAARE